MERRKRDVLFFYDAKVDTGAILNSHKTHIGPSETTGDLYQRLKYIGAEALSQALEIVSGNYQLQPQDDRLATPAPKVFKRDGQLDSTNILIPYIINFEP